MIHIHNGTEHEIVIYDINQTEAIENGRKLILLPDAKPVTIIPSGSNLNCVKENAKAPFLETDIPLKGAVEFVSHDPIPNADIVIVSNLFRSAVKELGGDTSKLATVDGVVYLSAEDKKPCGCLGLAVG